MTTLDTRPRAPVLRPLSRGSFPGRRPVLKVATARLPVGHPIVLRFRPVMPGTPPARDRCRRRFGPQRVTAGQRVTDGNRAWSEAECCATSGALLATVRAILRYVHDRERRGLAVLRDLRRR